ncbi:uncharacterized protein LOC121369310 [Gigantopelta aegis]|uniref:uncharacterized protein LOC121369310 n=1 Tax=Gigantopelta aegis TaxID=1735272 RepID=UPI001B88DF7E|nr:uncharacterized protein LOC121369310 [Gigantopelta aegis]
MLQSLLHSGAAEVEDVDNVFNLPLTTEQDVEELDEILKDKLKRKSFSRYLASLGGYGVKNMVDRTMSAVFTNPLATRFNWSGKAGKLSFSKLLFSKVLKSVAKRQSIREADCEEAVKKWLKNSIDRDDGRKRRASKKKQLDLAKETVSSSSESD